MYLYPFIRRRRFLFIQCQTGDLSPKWETIDLKRREKLGLPVYWTCCFSSLSAATHLNRERERESNLPEWLSRHDNIICSIDMVSGQMSISLSVCWSVHQCWKKRTRSFQLSAYYADQWKRLYLFSSEEKKLRKIKNICSTEDESMLVSRSKSNVNGREGQ